METLQPGPDSNPKSLKFHSQGQMRPNSTLFL
jgi:hypothetical protein